MSSLKSMTPAHKHALNSNQVLLVESLDVSHKLLSILQQDYSLTEEHVEEIQVQVTRSAKAARLLTILRLRPDKAFDRFVFALVQTGQDHCAHQLDPTAAEQYIMSRKPPAHLATDHQLGDSTRGQPLLPQYLPNGMTPNLPYLPFVPYLPMAMNPYLPHPYGPVSGWPQVGPAPPPEHLSAPVQEIDESREKKRQLEVADFKAVVDGCDAVMRIDVAPVDPAEAIRLMNSEIIYDMKKKVRGRAVIVSNQYFMLPKHEFREGAQFDVANIGNLVLKLGFEPVFYENKAKKELLKLLDEERLEKCQSDHEAFMLFLLTHGNRGCVFTSDGEKVLISDITTIFDGVNCRALRGKPKMFFIQACQGSERSLVYSSDGVDAAPTQEEQSPESIDPKELAEKLAEMRLEDAPGYAPELPPVANGQHEKADMLISYATVKGYEAWRQCKLGSWFIRSLVYVWSREAHSTHLLDMLTKVNYLMSQLETSETKLPYRQVAEKRDTFLKKLYFLPNLSLP